MQNIATNVYQEIKTTADINTGEVVTVETNKIVKIPSEPPYVKMYLDDVCLLANIPSGAKDVLLFLVRKIDFDGYITISSRFRINICEALNIKNQTLSNKIQSLCKSGLIKTIGKNEYRANPQFFAKGSWQDIYKRRAKEDFVLTIKYKNNGQKEINTQIVPEDEISLF